MDAFGGWLREKRAECGMTQEAVAETARARSPRTKGLQRSNLALWESGGRVPSVEQLAVLADVLAVGGAELRVAIRLLHQEPEPVAAK